MAVMDDVRDGLQDLRSLMEENREHLDVLYLEVKALRRIVEALLEPRDGTAFGLEADSTLEQGTAASSNAIGVTAAAAIH